MAQTENIRELALETLLLITRDGEHSHVALSQVLEKYQYLDKKDRAFLTRLVEGTLERQIELDYVIDQFSKVKVNKMKPVIRTIIRSAVYQMKYMDSVPNSAVCNEAVKLAVKKGFVGLKGFVNGVLRSIGRNLDNMEYPAADTIEGLSVRYSMPEWILRQWLSVYDRETVEGMLAYFLKDTPTAIRCNLSHISREELKKELKQEGVAVKEHPSLPYALLISGYDYLGALASFRRGDFQVQDVSSMMAAEWAAPKEGDFIIDTCAAPGGKALHLADKLKGTGMVEACDLTDYKVNLIRENIARTGAENIRAIRRDATVLEEAKRETADIVIADVPCSGLGVLGKKTDLKYKMTPEIQEELVRLQRNILSAAQSYVKPGGTLLYSTCTVHRAENEENAAWFAEEFPAFTLERERQILPGEENSDGFYLAKFKRFR